MAPLVVTRLQGNLRIDGRHLELTNATGQFYGGTLGGSLDAHLDAAPSYNVDVEFSQADIPALSANWPGLAGLFAGSASGEASFQSRGATREDLASSLACRGTMRLNGAELRNINLAESLREATHRQGVSDFSEASAAFTCAGGKVQFQDFLLAGPEEAIVGSGTIDFRRNLDLRLQVLPRGAAATHAPGGSAASASMYQVTGLLAAPQFKRLPSPRRPR